MRDPFHGRAAQLLAATLASFLLAACREPAPEASGTPCGGLSVAVPGLPDLDLESPVVSRQNLRAWVELLASPRLAGRHAGDSGARAAAALLAAQMAAFGLAAPWPEGYCQGFPLLDAEDYNVVAHLSSGPEATPRPVVLVAAHYDGQGTHPAGAIYPGADDNASGVAALLEVARLARRRGGPDVDWVFAALGGEEVGQQGARAYLAAPSLDLSRVELMVDLDMVGRPLPAATPEAIGFLAAGGSPEATAALLRRAATVAAVEVVNLEDFGDLRPDISDAEVFAARLPTVLLSTALHADHHELTDTPERVDDSQVERAAALALALADILAARR